MEYSEDDVSSADADVRSFRRRRRFDLRGDGGSLRRKEREEREREEGGKQVDAPVSFGTARLAGERERGGDHIPGRTIMTMRINSRTNSPQDLNDYRFSIIPWGGYLLHRKMVFGD